MPSSFQLDPYLAGVATRVEAELSHRHVDGEEGEALVEIEPAAPAMERVPLGEAGQVPRPLGGQHEERVIERAEAVLEAVQGIQGLREHEPRAGAGEAAERHRGAVDEVGEHGPSLSKVRAA